MSTDLIQEARSTAARRRESSPTVADLLDRLAAELERLTAKRPPLTPKQRAVYACIADRIERCGYAPTLDDIARTLGYRSLASVHEHLENLEEKGYIRREHNRPHAITLIGEMAHG